MSLDFCKWGQQLLKVTTYCHSTGLRNSPWKLTCENLPVPNFKDKSRLYIGEIGGQCTAITSQLFTLLEEKGKAKTQIYLRNQTWLKLPQNWINASWLVRHLHILLKPRVSTMYNRLLLENRFERIIFPDFRLMKSYHKEMIIWNYTLFKLIVNLS